jgi:hypothetical protein
MPEDTELALGFKGTYVNDLRDDDGSRFRAVGRPNGRKSAPALTILSLPDEPSAPVMMVVPGSRKELGPRST